MILFHFKIHCHALHLLRFTSWVGLTKKISLKPFYSENCKFILGELEVPTWGKVVQVCRVCSADSIFA